MSDLEYSVAEEVMQEKQRTERQRHRKAADHLKAERGKEALRVPVTTKQAFDLKRVKRLSDLPEE